MRQAFCGTLIADCNISLYANIKWWRCIPWWRRVSGGNITVLICGSSSNTPVATHLPLMFQDLNFPCRIERLVETLGSECYEISLKSTSRWLPAYCSVVTSSYSPFRWRFKTSPLNSPSLPLAWTSSEMNSCIFTNICSGYQPPGHMLILWEATLRDWVVRSAAPFYDDSFCSINCADDYYGQYVTAMPLPKTLLNSCLAFAVITEEVPSLFVCSNSVWPRL